MDDGSLATTRRALHAVAELVLAGPQYRGSGDIRLRVTPDGFGTVTGPEVRVAGAELVTAEVRLPLRGRTCAGLAAAAGLEASALDDVYHDGTHVPADELLDPDPAAAAWLARCFAAGDDALRRLAPDETPVLWPEHFDVAIRVDATNYGVSPGDDHLAVPYAYVGPDAVPTGPFWNQPFGAARPLHELDDAAPDAVLAFFTEGRRIIATT